MLSGSSNRLVGLTFLFASFSVMGATLTYENKDSGLNDLSFCTATVDESTIVGNGLMRVAVTISDVLHGGLVQKGSQEAFLFKYGKGTAIPSIDVTPGNLVLMALKPGAKGACIADGFVEVMPRGHALHVLATKDDAVLTALRKIFAIVQENDKERKYNALLNAVNTNEELVAGYASATLVELSGDEIFRNKTERIFRELRDNASITTRKRLMADKYLICLLPATYSFAGDRKAFLERILAQSNVDREIREEVLSRLEYAQHLEKAEKDRGGTKQE